MKIGPIESKPVATAPAERKKPAQPIKVEHPAEPSAQVDLSSAAQKLAGAASSDASFDSAKVERIAQAIRDGKFTVNADAIADKLIVNAEELLGRKIS